MHKTLTIEKLHAWHEGWWPVGLKLKDKWLAQMGAPLGAERRRALETYYYGGNDALKRHGPRGTDKKYFRWVVQQTFFVLRQFEGGYQFRRVDAESILPCLQVAYAAGYDPAVRHAHRFCVETKTPMDMDNPQTAWICDWSERFLEEHTRLLPIKKKVGRPNGPTSQKWMEDLEILVLVNSCRSQVGSIYRTGKPHWVSLDRAFEIIRRIYHPDAVFDAADRRYIPALKMAYKRTVKRFSKKVISLI